MDNTPIFPDGIIWKDAHDKAPAFIKGAIHVQAEKLAKWLQSNPSLVSEKGWIVLDLKEPKNKGNYYFSVNTWKPIPKEEREPTNEEMQAHSPLGKDYPVSDPHMELNPEDIPF